MTTLADSIKRKAKEIGFDLVGIAPLQRSIYTDYVRQWLDAGKAGTMHWLANRFEERTDPTQYFPGAKTAICVACNYHVALDATSDQPNSPFSDGPEGHASSVINKTARPSAPSLNGVGKIARYALGEDYHIVIKDRLHALADWLHAQVPDVQTRCGVDTAPILEKELAARAGIGWMGKNTCIINTEIGSYVLLGQILTTLDLPTDLPVDDRCGSCTRCIDACPTHAITAPYQMDASRCISYLTIEHRGEIAEDLQHKTGNWLYGCDICQEVCPWNRKAPLSTDPAFAPRFPGGWIEINRVMSWSDEDYRRTLKDSAMKRVKLPMLQRNAGIVAKNTTARS